MRNIALTFLGCFTILAACSNSDDAEKPVVPVPTGDVAIYTTTSSLTRDLARDAVNLSPKDNLAPTTITLNPAEQYQTMDGFGAAITGSTCYNLLLMKPADRHAFLTETFSDKDGFGFSYIRISIGCSDFSLSEYTCCDTKGIENFALQSEEKDYILPILKEILAINPSIKVIAAPWACPADRFRTGTKARNLSGYGTALYFLPRIHRTECPHRHHQRACFRRRLAGAGNLSGPCHRRCILADQTNRRRNLRHHACRNHLHEYGT